MSFMEIVLYGDLHSLVPVLMVFAVWVAAPLWGY